MYDHDQLFSNLSLQLSSALQIGPAPQVLAALSLLGIKDALIVEILGFSPTSISLWRNNKTPIPPKRHQALLDLLRVGHAAAVKIIAEAKIKATTPADIAAAELYEAQVKRAGDMLDQLEKNHAA